MNWPWLLSAFLCARRSDTLANRTDHRYVSAQIPRGNQRTLWALVYGLVGPIGQWPAPTMRRGLLAVRARFGSFLRLVAWWPRRVCIRLDVPSAGADGYGRAEDDSVGKERARWLGQIVGSAVRGGFRCGRHQVGSRGCSARTSNLARGEQGPSTPRSNEAFLSTLRTERVSCMYRPCRHYIPFAA